MKLYTGYRSTPRHRQLGSAGELFVPRVSVKDLPDRVNWKEKGWLTEVKNQVSSSSSVQLRGVASIILVG